MEQLLCCVLKIASGALQVLSKHLGALTSSGGALCLALQDIARVLAKAL